MHYYKRNLGDYAKKAGRLSMLQHGSYTLLIDACYDREQFPTLDEAIEWTWASTTEEIEAVTFVLRKFFTLENGVYVQKRIQEEIAEYQEKAETNKRIAIERETKRKEKSTDRAQGVVVSSPADNEPPPNQEPITNNQYIPAANAPASPKQKRNAIEIKTYIAECKESGQPAIPENDTIFDYAEEAGIPTEHLRLCWREFVDRMTDAKTRKADWRAHFRNCVRGNWYKLWYIGDDGYELTTAGKQAQLKHGRAAA